MCNSVSTDETYLQFSIAIFTNVGKALRITNWSSMLWYLVLVMPIIGYANANPYKAAAQCNGLKLPIHEIPYLDFRMV